MTTDKCLNVLMIEDSEDDVLLIVRELKRAGIDVLFSRVETEETVLRALREKPWDVVISDFNMPRLTGLRALELVHQHQSDLPFILVSGSVGEQLAVQAMKAGAHDYIMKDNLARLSSAIEREVQEAGERRLRRAAESALEQKHRQLVAAQRMEAVGRLAGGLAHDLNNMIGACTLYAEMALDPDQDIEAVRDHVREIMKAQERSTRLISQLLSFSRRQIVDPQVITINQVVSEIQKMLRKILGENVELVLCLDPDLRSIKVDPGQIDQLIMNLVVNARDAMPKGGTLRIETVNETLRLGSPLLDGDTDLEPGPHVKLTVTDTGVGMDAATKAKIFEPFFTTKEVGKGTGLGLSTVHGIVKQAKGDIQVRTEAGKGTAFDIYFASVEGPEPCFYAKAEMETVCPRGSRKTLLLVEDDSAFRDSLSRVLKSMGCRVLLAKDGKEGMEVFESHRDEIDLLVSDVVMPHISGPEIASLIRKEKPALKVLFLSGYNHETLSSYGIDQMTTFVLAKPATRQQVAKKIAEILGECHE